MNDTHYNLIEDPQSDYEAIDTSLFGWWKAKLRKSQIRKVYAFYNYVFQFSSLKLYDVTKIYLTLLHHL